MKVVQINAVYEFSSTGRMTKEIHHYLHDAGIESHVFCTNKKDLQANIHLIGNKLDYKIHSFLSHLFGLQAYFSIIATCMLLQKLKTISPDLVHLHNLHSNYIHLPMLLKFLAKNKIATVLTLHDCWFFTGHCCHYTENQCQKWKQGCQKCPALHQYNASWWLDFSSKIYRDKKKFFAAIPRLAVIGNSAWTTRQARESLLNKAYILERIYNWIDLDRFYPRQKERGRVKLGLHPEDFVIMGVSQEWSEKKGLSVFIDLARHFPQYKIVLIGKCPSRVSLPANLITVAAVSSADTLAEYYSAADVFINPSLQETFGLVSAEALACGTPIIVNNATANPELVGENCGFVVNNNALNEYIDSINRIVAKGKEFYAASCRLFAQANFNKERNIAKYVEIYKQII
jgi:glycosyltransferase involved in cell wall biosynthesis